MSSRKTHETFARQRQSISKFTPAMEGVHASNFSTRAALPKSAIQGWYDWVLDRLGPKELRRRMWHFAPGVGALLTLAFPRQQPLELQWLVVTVAFCVVIACVAIHFQRTIRRPGEHDCLPSILGYAVAIIPLFFLFPAFPELPLTVAAIVAFGDGSATLVGRLAGDNKLPWNAHKSWLGTMAFVLAALPLATLIYWSESTPHKPLEAALFCVGPAVLATALVESLPFRCNDNIFVGGTAALSMIAMRGIVLGWS